MTERVILLSTIVLAVIFTARWLERRWPIDPHLPYDEVMADWKATFVNLSLFTAFGPFALPISATIVGWMGGGLIRLPTDGAWYVGSIVFYVLISDLYRYWMHRLTHAVPFLWAMHSFHHSANALTLITGARHFWLEKIITGMFMPLLPILFVIPADMAGIISIVYFLPDGCAHLNVRFSMGRAITWINNPQWHRIHHSTQPEHFNKNFSGGLPLWDLLFGTAWIPGREEYPPTGLVPAEQVGIIDSIIWPFRHLWRTRRQKSDL